MSDLFEDGIDSESHNRTNIQKIEQKKRRLSPEMPQLSPRATNENNVK
jgi:hypothetical protein